MSIRITIETLASGQPRAYADTRHHARVTVEYQMTKHSGPVWEPNSYLKEDKIRKMLLALDCGFTEHTVYELGKTKLDWLRNTGPGVWEFHTTDPFCD